MIYDTAIVAIEHFDAFLWQFIYMDIVGAGSIVCFAVAGIIYLLFVF